jgi:hypothetical protein
MTTDRWWVYKRPFLRDRLFIVGLVLGVVNLAFAVASVEGMGWLAAVLRLLFAVPSGILVVGIFGGIVRDFRTGRRDG